MGIRTMIAALASFVAIKSDQDYYLERRQLERAEAERRAQQRAAEVADMGAPVAFYGDLRSSPPGDRVRISNNVEYAERREGAT